MLHISQDRVEAMEHRDYIVGRHVFGNLYGVDPKLLWDRKLLEELVIEAAKAGKMNLVDVRSWSFPGKHGGVSVIALVVESHIAIHTWPEYSYATVDVYTCGSASDPFEAFKLIVSRLKPERVVAYYADRSSEPEKIDPEKLRGLLAPLRLA